MNSKPRRAQGGLGLLSHTISVQRPQESIPLILVLGRRARNREETGRRGGARKGRWCSAVLAGAWGERERGEGYLRCPRRSPKYP